MQYYINTDYRQSTKTNKNGIKAIHFSETIDSRNINVVSNLLKSYELLP